MEESLRRRYLAAMDIPLWLPRTADTVVIGGPPAAAAVRTAEPEPVWNEPVPARKPEPASRPRTVTDVAPVQRRIIQPRRNAEPLQNPQSQVQSLEMDPPPGADLDALDWSALSQRVAACTACNDLVANRSRTVFGVGNRQADLMVIGEAPGMDEDRQGEPFVGRAGQLLNRMLRAMGFTREQVFIANILKCRPPNNRDPHVDEAARCEAFLLRQLALVAPRAILSVGRISAQNLLKTDAALSRLRGRVHYFGATRIPLVVTYHPAYLLRSPEYKAKAWGDLQMAMGLLRAG